MNPRIEPMNEARIEGFHAALDFVAREKRYLAFVAAPPLDEVGTFVCGNLAAGNPALLLLDDDSVVGWCDVVRSRQDCKQHSGILGLAVLPHYRGCGWGRALMSQTIALAWQRGFTRIELGVRLDNQRAMKLYESLGFQPEGRRIAAMKVDDKYYDSLAMALLHPDIATDGAP